MEKKLEKMEKLENLEKIGKISKKIGIFKTSTRRIIKKTQKIQKIRKILQKSLAVFKSQRNLNSGAIS